MIVGSLLLILVAVGLLVAGVLSSSNALIIGSIVATVIAAIVLILGVRQSANRADEEEEFGEVEPDGADNSSVHRGSSTHGSRLSAPPDRDHDGERRSVMTETVAAAIPTQSRDGHESTDGESAVPTGTAESVATDDDPPDEPSAQLTSPSNTARIATMTTEVLVIDGRPRYHLNGCVHLLGRDSEPLAVGEALELGFSPCGLCEPDSALLAEAQQA